MLDVADVLTAQMETATNRGDQALLVDLLDEKLAIERRFQDSRAATWHAWMTAQYPDAMAPYSGRMTP